MKYFLIFGLTLLMLSCSSTNQSSYFGYNNNPKVEDKSNDEIEVYQTGNNTSYTSNNNDDQTYNKVTNVYVLPPGYYNPWDYYGMGYPNYYFYWDNWRFNRWAYYNPYSYWDYGWYNPYRYPNHYYDHYYYNDYYYGGNYSDNETPKRKDYRDFGVSRGDFGSPSRNIISNSSKRESGVTPSGSVRTVNSSNSRSNNNDYNRPNYNTPDSQNSRVVTSPTKNSSSQRNSNVDRNSQQSQPRYEQPKPSVERAPSNSGTSSGSSRGSSNSSSSRSTEKSSGSSSSSGRSR